MGKLPAALKGQASVLANGESGTIDGLPVTAIAAYNTTPDRLQYHPKGVGNGYRAELWRQEGLYRRRHRGHARNAGADAASTSPSCR